jgi:hypothetical protein
MIAIAQSLCGRPQPRDGVWYCTALRKLMQNGWGKRQSSGQWRFKWSHARLAAQPHTLFRKLTRSPVEIASGGEDDIRGQTVPDYATPAATAA